jgi:hypothetical protein
VKNCKGYIKAGPSGLVSTGEIVVYSDQIGLVGRVEFFVSCDKVGLVVIV